MKRDLNEDAARMIAEVVPPAAEVATKTDIADLRGYIDSRLLRYTLAFMVPMWAMTGGLLAALVARI